jgi:hypothetical protein
MTRVKKSMILCVLLGFIAMAGTGQVVLQRDVHDFGKIPKNKDVSCVFEIENTGDAILVVESVQAG